MTTQDGAGGRADKNTFRARQLGGGAYLSSVGPPISLLSRRAGFGFIVNHACFQSQTQSMSTHLDNGQADSCLHERDSLHFDFIISCQKSLLARSIFEAPIPWSLFALAWISEDTNRRPLRDTPLQMQVTKA
jgi:hypothetical protein